MGTALAVEASGLGRRYAANWALRGIDLNVGEGEMVGVVGPDGTGKTTLLQMCAAILDPSEGGCSVLGFDTVAEGNAVTARIGYMSQGFTLYDRLSVEENLRFAAAVRGVPDGEYRERRRQLLAMAGLEFAVGRPAGKLSGGMRKKLSLCTNLIHEPRLLILDEPGLGVDPLSRSQLWSMLEAFRQTGISILVATSYMDEADRCDRVLLLGRGSALASAAPEVIRAQAEGRVFEIVTRNGSAVGAELGRDPNLYGIQVLSDRVRFQRRAANVEPAIGEEFNSWREAPATLEDVFVLHAASDEVRSQAMPPVAAIPEPAGIRADSLTVEFGGFRAVDHVSLAAKPGELLALLGPNGAGKTTLIRSFCDLVSVSEGAAWLGDERVGSGISNVRQRIGYMSQNFSLYADMTIAENLEFFASAYGLKRAVATQAIDWACQVADIDVNRPGLVDALSGAARQRLALACSILHRPAVLFLDEPTSGIDPLSRYRFWQLIRALAVAGMTIVVTTHYLDEAEYCDRIGLMHHGRLIANGTLKELRRTTASPENASVEHVFIEAVRHSEVSS